MKVFLLKFTSVLLTEVKSFAIISSLVSILRKRFISHPLLVLSFDISLNKLYFFVEKQTTRYILPVSCTEKLKYFLGLSFESINGETSERYLDKDLSKEIKNNKLIPNK